LDFGLPRDHILKDPDFEMLLSLSVDQMILVNDMYSYRHEAFGLGGQNQQCSVPSENGDLHAERVYYVFNAVCILLRQDGVNETNVMDRLGAHIGRKESDFMATLDKLEARFKDRIDDLTVIQVWVKILKQWMAGNYCWSNMCRRYNNFNDLPIDD
jgi:hypothetical protein